MTSYNKSKINNYDFFKDCLENDIRKGVTLFNLTPEQIQTAMRDVAENVVEIAGDVPID